MNVPNRWSLFSLIVKVQFSSSRGKGSKNRQWTMNKEKLKFCVFKYSKIATLNVKLFRQCKKYIYIISGFAPNLMDDVLKLIVVVFVEFGKKLVVVQLMLTILKL